MSLREFLIRNHSKLAVQSIDQGPIPSCPLSRGDDEDQPDQVPVLSQQSSSPAVQVYHHDR